MGGTRLLSLSVRWTSEEAEKHKMRWLDGVVVAIIILAGLVGGRQLWIMHEPSNQFLNKSPILLGGFALVLGTVSAYLALRQLYINSRNRAADENWKRAEAARDMLDRMFDDEEAYGALRMIEDEPEELFYYESDQGFTVSTKDVNIALEDWDQGSRKCRLIRRNFDSLAFYLVRIQYFIQDGFVSLAVIQPTMEYNVMRLAQIKDPVSRYFRRIGHDGAILLLEKFDQWNRPDSYGPVDMLST